MLLAWFSMEHEVFAAVFCACLSPSLVTFKPTYHRGLAGRGVSAGFITSRNAV